jgi:hypothetical protein
LTTSYSERANSGEYTGPEYVVNGTLTPAGKEAVAKLLVSANVNKDLLAASLGENDALREMLKQITKDQWKNVLRGMGLGAGMVIIIMILLMLSQERGQVYA